MDVIKMNKICLSNDPLRHWTDEPAWENRFAIHNLIRDLSRIYKDILTTQ